METATVRRGFKRIDTKAFASRGTSITAEAKYIGELRRDGFVYETTALPGAPETKTHPSSADGKEQKSSASPAVPVSAQTTAKKSGAGAKKVAKASDES